MMKATHAISAFTAGYLVTNDIQFSLYSLIFGLISDLDLIVGIKHRTFTHSLAFLVGTSILVGFVNKYIAIAAFIGIAVHILLDMLTKYGVQLYWPLRKRVRLAKFSYDGLLPNYAIILTCWILIIYFGGIKMVYEIQKILKFV